MNLEASQVVTGYNVAWIVSAAAVAFVFTSLSIRRFREGKRDYATDLIFGVALVSYGSIIHRIFWLVYGWLQESGRHNDAEWLVAGAVPVGLTSTILVTTGYAYHFSPIAKRWFHRRFMLAIFLAMDAVFFGSAFIHHYFF